MRSPRAGFFASLHKKCIYVCVVGTIRKGREKRALIKARERVANANVLRLSFRECSVNIGDGLQLCVSLFLIAARAVYIGNKDRTATCRFAIALASCCVCTVYTIVYVCV